MSANTRDSNRKGTRLLVVDDDEGQRSLLESFLAAQGYDIVTASSGERRWTSSKWDR